MLALVVHLICLAALFLLLRAEFVAAAQVVVYAGAVMVLYVFVVAYVGGTGEPMPRGRSRPACARLSMLFAGVLLVELWIALLGTGLKAVDERGRRSSERRSFGTPEAIGEALLTKFLLPFELASLLLLVAAVGAVVLARRRRGTGRGGRWPSSASSSSCGPRARARCARASAGSAQIEPEPPRPEVTAGDREPEGGW